MKKPNTTAENISMPPRKRFDSFIGSSLELFKKYKQVFYTDVMLKITFKLKYFELSSPHFFFKAKHIIPAPSLKWKTTEKACIVEDFQ